VLLCVGSALRARGAVRTLFNPRHPAAPVRALAEERGSRFLSAKPALRLMMRLADDALPGNTVPGSPVPAGHSLRRQSIVNQPGGHAVPRALVAAAAAEVDALPAPHLQLLLVAATLSVQFTAQQLRDRLLRSGIFSNGAAAIADAAAREHAQTAAAAAAAAERAAVGMLSDDTLLALARAAREEQALLELSRVTPGSGGVESELDWEGGRLEGTIGGRARSLAHWPFARSLFSR
jgi:hypothetical protein